MRPKPWRLAWVSRNGKKVHGQATGGSGSRLAIPVPDGYGTGLDVVWTEGNVGQLVAKLLHSALHTLALAHESEATKDMLNSLEHKKSKLYENAE